MPASSFAPHSVARNNPTVLWVIALLLAVIAGILIGRGNGEATAIAQTTPLAGGRGVFAFTGPIEGDRYGLFMLDIEQGTLWCYEIDNVGGVRKLRLFAARSWLYDRYLQEFNVDGLSPVEVQALVAKQRSRPDDTKKDKDEKRDANAAAPKDGEKKTEKPEPKN